MTAVDDDKNDALDADIVSVVDDDDYDAGASAGELCDAAVSAADPTDNDDVEDSAVAVPNAATLPDDADAKYSIMMKILLLLVILLLSPMMMTL